MFFIKIVFFIALMGCSHRKIDLSENIDSSKHIEESANVVEVELKDRFQVEVTEPEQSVTKKSPKKVDSQKTHQKTSSDKETAFQPAKSLLEKLPHPWTLHDKKWVRVGEKFVLNIQYMGLAAATLTMEVKKKAKMDGREVFHFQARAKTEDYYRWIYHLDDVVESYVDVEHFVPLKYSLIQREKNKNIDRVEIYDRNNLQTHYRYYQVKKGKESKEKLDAEIPLFSQDLFSSYFFIKGLPLKIGDEYTFPVTSKAKTWNLKVSVEQLDKVRVKIGEFSAIKLKVETHYEGKLAKKGTFYYWLSNDEDRKFLKFQAEVKIGSVKGELAQYFSP